MLQQNITKEELNELPLNAFEGEIEIVDTPLQAEKAVAYLSQFEVLGFDTETKPSFKKGQINRVALLQLSSGEKAFLFRLQKLELPLNVRQLLACSSIKKVGVAIRDDIKTLQKISYFEPDGFVELQEKVKAYGISAFSLKKIAGIVLGIRISKSQRLSNWESEILTGAQQSYAATDAWVSYQIYYSLINKKS